MDLIGINAENRAGLDMGEHGAESPCVEISVCSLFPHAACQILPKLRDRLTFLINSQALLPTTSSSFQY